MLKLQVDGRLAQVKGHRDQIVFLYVQLVMRPVQKADSTDEPGDGEAGDTETFVSPIVYELFKELRKLRTSHNLTLSCPC